MDGSGAGGNRLDIRSFRAEYLVSSDHPSPENLKARLDETLTKSLPELLSSIVSRLFSGDDLTVWLIRRLDLGIDVNAAWDREQLARRWVAQIARSLAVTLQEGEDGQNVMRFDNRAAYLSRFLVDLSNGCAWGRWYYEGFDGLRMLPVSAALRTAICDQPAAGLAALVQLNANDLTGVLRALATQDARRILLTISDNAPAGNEARCFQALWKIWETAELAMLSAEEEWRNSLRLYLRVCRDDMELSSQALGASALALLRFARCLASSGREKLLAALIGGDISALYLAAGTGNAEILTPLIRCPPDWVKEVGQTIISRYNGQVIREPAATTEYRYTPFGGIFLLLPLLDALPLEKAATDWPGIENTNPASLLRFLILTKCCGLERAHRVFFDPLVRDLLGIDPSVDLTSLSQWQARISKASLETFLQEFSSWQYECGYVGYETMALVRIALPGSPVGVLIDCRRGVWMYGESYHPKQPNRFVRGLHHWLSQSEQESVVLSDDAFIEPMRSAFPECKIYQLHSHSEIQMAEKDKGIVEVRSRLDKVPQDLKYLSLPKAFRISRSFDLALSIVAKGLMASFAWRLPGFAWSSLPYLYANFLEFSASMEDESARRVVRLGRAPLNLVLGIAGMTRGTYRLSWLDERPFALFQE